MNGFSRSNTHLKPTQRAFLRAFRLTCSVTRAAAAAKVDRLAHYRWLDNTPGYPAAFADARREGITVLEDEAVRRAHEGVRKLVVSRGQVVYVERRDADGKPILGEDGQPLTEPLVEHEYSDTLMCLLLKGGLPDRYKERVSQEVSGPGGGPIALRNADLRRLSDAELATLEVLIEKSIEPARQLTELGANSSGKSAPEAG